MLRSELEIPGGNVTEGSRQLLVRTMGKYNRVEDFNRVIVATPMGKPVYLLMLQQLLMELRTKQFNQS